MPAYRLTPSATTLSRSDWHYILSRHSPATSNSAHKLSACTESGAEVPGFPIPIALGRSGPGGAMIGAPLQGRGTTRSPHKSASTFHLRQRDNERRFHLAKSLAVTDIGKPTLVAHGAILRAPRDGPTGRTKVYVYLVTRQMFP